MTANIVTLILVLGFIAVIALWRRR